MLVPKYRYEYPTRAEEPAGVVVLGSTGSIGTAALEIIRKSPARFRVHALCANSSVEALLQQTAEFRPAQVVVADENAFEQLQRDPRVPALSEHTEFSCGGDAICAAAADPLAPIVVAAIVGMAGLPAVCAAIGANKRIALANKEALVAGGAVVASLLSESSAELLPVDSEHSAIFQAIQGEAIPDVHRIVLTASGGPFRSRSVADFPRLTPEEAVRHPNWSMGRKISVDSATMMNKALEVIEAHWLFDLPGDRIGVLVHPESIVHSIVELVDGGMLAQLSVPDMKGAISYAMSYGSSRVAGASERLDLAAVGALHFGHVDSAKFPSIEFAYEALRRGGTASLVLNVANEVAVEAFLARRIPFDRIFSFNREAFALSASRPCQNLAEILALEREVRAELAGWVARETRESG